MIDIRTGWAHSIFLSANNLLYACGHNQHGKCGVGRDSEYKYQVGRITLMKIDHIDHKQYKFTDIQCGFGHTMVSNDKGEIFSCGHNEFNQLGFIDNHDVYVLKKITYFENRKIKIKRWSGGAQHSVFLSNDGKVYLFGNKFCGQFSCNKCKSYGNCKGKEIKLSVDCIYKNQTVNIVDIKCCDYSTVYEYIVLLYILLRKGSIDCSVILYFL